MYTTGFVIGQVLWAIFVLTIVIMAIYPGRSRGSVWTVCRYGALIGFVLTWAIASGVGIIGHGEYASIVKMEKIVFAWTPFVMTATSIVMLILHWTNFTWVMRAAERSFFDV